MSEPDGPPRRAGAHAPRPAWRAAALVAAWAAAAAIGVVSLLPPRGTPGVEIAELGEFRAWVGHALAYAVLGACAVASQRVPRPGVTFAAVVAYGCVLEVVQGATGLRSMQWGDVLANALGTAAGIGGALLVMALARPGRGSRREGADPDRGRPPTGSAS